MGKNKKPARNPFYFFMMELKNRDPRKYGNMQQVSQDAGKLWDSMTPQQKQPYEQKSKMERGRMKSGALTTSGLSMAFIEKREREEMEQDQKRKDFIEHTVKSLAMTGELAEHTFYIIHMNYYCQYTSAQKKLRHLPAEVGVTKFTLKDGVLTENVFHAIIKPAQLPIGYPAAAKAHSESTHKIVPPLVFNENCNFTEVFDAFLTFVEEAQNPQTILYCQEQDLAAVEDMLLYLSDETEMDFNFGLYSVEYLLFHIRNTISDNKWPSLNMCKSIFERDPFSFCTEITCDYHRDMEVYLHCSRSFSIRIAYMICDQCCIPLGVKLLPGVHMPQKSKVKNDNLFRMKSNMSLTSSSDYNYGDNERCDSRMSQFTTSTMTNDFDRHSEFQDDSEPEYDETVTAMTRSFSQSSTASFQESRRPTTLSAGVTRNFSTPSSSASAYGRGESSGLVRGTGRGGIAANFSNDFSDNYP